MRSSQLFFSVAAFATLTVTAFSVDVDGAILLPLTAIQDGLTKDELAKLPKDKILYIHCVVGKRAVTGGNAIEKLGFTVKPIKQGYKELIAAGLPKAKD